MSPTPSLRPGATDGSRALLATMCLAGLRVSDLCSLRWRSVDLARGILTVEESKTDAGEGRAIDLSPMLRSELTLHKANAGEAEPDGLVFPTRNGTMQHRAKRGVDTELRGISDEGRLSSESREGRTGTQTHEEAPQRQGGWRAAHRGHRALQCELRLRIPRVLRLRPRGHHLQSGRSGR